MERRIVGVVGILATVGCADPHCPPGEIKIADTCYAVDDPDAGEADAIDTRDASVDANGIDSGSGADASTNTVTALDAATSTADAAPNTAPPGASDATTPPTMMPSCSPANEICDGRDNDCDGMIDEGVTNACGGCTQLVAEPGTLCTPTGAKGACATTGAYVCAGKNG